MAKMEAAERTDGDREETVLVKINKSNNKNCRVRKGNTKSRMRKSSGKGTDNSRDSPPGRSSIYRGVTRHRWTGRYEAHLWDKCTWNESQNKKGRQVYLGAYDDEAAAGRAYDLAALKYWGRDTLLNFPLSAYGEELDEMEGQSKEEYIGSLRRKSSGFSRGVSKYRGVARHHHNGRWEARIGRVFGNKYLYLGTYATQEEAATAYDMAAIEYRGLNAVTNFDLSRYVNLIGKRHEDNNNPDIVETAGSRDGNNNVACLQTDSKVVQAENNITNNHTDAHERADTTRMDHNYIDPGSDGTQGLILPSKKLKKILARASSTTPDCQESVVPPRDSDPPRKIFPDDIQTYFGCLESSDFGEIDDIIFGELDSITSTLFQCEMDI